MLDTKELRFKAHGAVQSISRGNESHIRPSLFLGLNDEGKILWMEGGYCLRSSQISHVMKEGIILMLD